MDIPAGTHFEYKLLVKNHWGRWWEPGGNREHTADPLAGDDTVRAHHR